MKSLRSIGATAVALAVVTACSSAGGSGDGATASGKGAGDTVTVTVAYNVNGDFPEPKSVLEAAKKGFESANPTITVELQPQVAPDDQFHTKMALTLKAGSNVPDVIYYPPQFVDGDAKAGYLSPLDDELATWQEWEQFAASTRDGLKNADGKTYSVPFSANTMGIWYSKSVLSTAGITVPWQPKSWDDLLEAAQKIAESNPDTIPVHLYAGKASGASDSTIKSFRPLLHGTGKSLFADGKWQPADDDFEAAWAFMRELYAKDLTAPKSDVLSPNIWANIGPWMKNGELGFVIDGNWMSYNWIEGGPSEWPEWGDELGIAAIPSRDGGDPVSVGLPGPGLVRAAKSKQPEAAMKFIQFATNKENSQLYAMNSGQLAVRADVAADPAYAESPTISEFTTALEYASYVPMSEAAARIEALLADINEKVALGSLSPADAAKQYNDEVPKIAGVENFAS